MRSTRAFRTIVPAIAILTFASCQNTSFYSVLGNKAQIQALAISPSSTTVPPNGTIQFTASGGVPPYTFSILSGGSGTIDPSTGLYTAPPTPGTTYVQVMDKNGATAKATLTNVDYSVTSVTPPSTSLYAGGTASGSFSVQNVGTAAGAQTVSWTVYVSTTNTLSSGGATTFAQGTTPALGAGASTSVPFTGTWPTTPGTYYLIATVFSTDGLVAPNNTMASSGVTITAASVNYVASSVTITSAASAAPGTAMTGSFTLTNSGANGGTQYVTWEAYASTTTTITGSSVLLDSGNHAPLGAGTGTSITVTGTWPLAYGDYYLVVKSSVPVDSNASNNLPFASASAASIGIYTTTEPNDTTAQANNFGVTLQPGMSIKVSGSLTTSDLNDYIAFGVGTASNVTFNLTWPSTGLSQTVTMWMYSPSGTQLVGLTTSDNTYLIMSWPTTGYSGTTCYISPQLSGSPGTGAYTLTITAN